MHEAPYVFANNSTWIFIMHQTTYTGNNIEGMQRRAKKMIDGFKYLELLNRLLRLDLRLLLLRQDDPNDRVPVGFTTTNSFWGLLRTDHIGNNMTRYTSDPSSRGMIV